MTFGSPFNPEGSSVATFKADGDLCQLRICSAQNVIEEDNFDSSNNLLIKDESAISADSKELYFNNSSDEIDAELNNYTDDVADELTSSAPENLPRNSRCSD